MSRIQRYILQTIGFSYAIGVVFKLLWNFVFHPSKYLRAFNEKPPRESTECLKDERYGTHTFVKLKDVNLHYVSKGDAKKPLMLFLHGFPDFWLAWRHQINRFSENYRTVAVDLRGYGDSDKPEDITAYLTTQLREDIYQLVHSLNYKTCILVAHDVGGTVAYHVATRFPEIVDKLIILNSPHPAVFLDAFKTSRSQKSKSWYMILFQVPYIPEILLRVFDYDLLRRLCGGKLGSARTEEEEESYKLMYSKNGFTGQLNFYRAAFSYRTETVSTEIKAPTLLLWGTCDTCLDTDLAELNKAYLPDLKIKFLCDAGHWPHIDEPDKVNSAILNFLEDKKEQEMNGKTDAIETDCIRQN